MSWAVQVGSAANGKAQADRAVPDVAASKRATHLSASRLKVFLTCPRKHRFQYVDQVLPEYRSIALAFGSAWHHAVGAWLLGAPDDPALIDTVRQAFRDALLAEVDAPGPPVLFDDEGGDLGRTIDQGIAMLDVFTQVVPHPPKTVAVELAFELDLAHPHTGEVVPIPFIGSLDAVIEAPEQFVVWELKSGKRRWSDDQLEYDIQPTLYSAAAENLGCDGARVQVLVTTKCRKPEVQIAAALRTTADTAELVETSLALVSAMEQGVDHRIRGWQCRICAYSAACR